MSELAGWTQVNRSYCVPFPCFGQRFYNTVNDPGPFWQWSYEQVPSDDIWHWLYDFSWLRVRNARLTSRWEWDVFTTSPFKQVVIELADNPDYDPGVEDREFIIIVRVKTNLGAFPANYRSELPFTKGDLGRGTVLTLLPDTIWIQESAPWPGTHPPLGTLVFRPRQCLPNFDPLQPPL